MTEELVVLNLDESVQSKFEMQFSSSAHYSKSQIFVQKFNFEEEDLSIMSVILLKKYKNL